jgi:hypothetical protein
MLSFHIWLFKKLINAFSSFFFWRNFASWRAKKNPAEFNKGPFENLKKNKKKIAIS